MYIEKETKKLIIICTGGINTKMNKIMGYIQSSPIIFHWFRSVKAFQNIESWSVAKGMEVVVDSFVFHNTPFGTSQQASHLFIFILK